MKAIYVICSIVLFFLTTGCKQDAATNEPSGTEMGVAESGQAIDKQRDSRPVTAGHDYNFLTDKILLFNTVMGSEKGDKGPVKGDWIHLKTDGTYLAGRLAKQTHTGQWAYEHDKQLLFLRPDTQDYKLSEWKVMATDQVIVWVGTSTYGDNSIQIQLLKSDTLPE